LSFVQKELASDATRDSKLSQLNSASTERRKKMKAFRQACVVVTVSILLGMSALSQAPPDSKSARRANSAVIGIWKGSIKGAPGDPLDFTMEVWSEKGSLRGEIKTFQGDVSKGKIAITGGTYVNGEFSASMLNEVNSTGKFACKIKGDRFTGTWSIANISGTVEAAKVSTTAKKAGAGK
jgi:hypothetical protein